MKSLFIPIFGMYLLGLGIGVFIGHRNGNKIGYERGINDTQISAIEAGVGEHVITNKVENSLQ